MLKITTDLKSQSFSQGKEHTTRKNHGGGTRRCRRPSKKIGLGSSNNTSNPDVMRTTISSERRTKEQMGKWQNQRRMHTRISMTI